MTKRKAVKVAKRGPKRKAVKVAKLGTIPSDNGSWWVIERRWWADGSSCLQGIKWAVQPNTGRPAPWWPLQAFQCPWELAPAFVNGLAAAVSIGQVSVTERKETG